MGKKKKKLDLDQSGEPLSNPFEALNALDAAALPSGPETVPLPKEPEAEKPSRKGELILRRETAHRGGKAVIIVTGFEASRAVDLDALARFLKKKCGTGGTVKGREIEVQGEKAKEVAEILRGEGYRVRGLGV